MSMPSLHSGLNNGTKLIVSIGLPVFNGANFLAEAIESILAQEMGDFELMISDNASTDETPAICERYAALDARISYVRHPANMGAANNYNHVFHCTSAKYFKWAAHDDLLKPRFLSECIAAFEAFETPPAIVYPRSEFIDDAGMCFVWTGTPCILRRRILRYGSFARSKV